MANELQGLDGKTVDESDAPGAEVLRSEEDILKEARARLELASEAELEIRKAALDDLRFRAGEQWHDKDRADRDRDGRPCLTINRLPQFVQQVTNDHRQNRPAIKVSAIDNSATEDTAEVIQGLVRHIEVNSNAEVAYDTGFESAANGGFGYWRVVTDYADPESFDQEIFIKRIRNPFSVFLDPFASEPDGSDARWGFVVDDISKDDYRAQYPDSKLAQPEADWKAIGAQAPSWMMGDSARVAEYFEKEFEEATIHLLKTGETVRDEKLSERQAQAQAAGLDASVVRTRRTKIPVIKWRKINAIEILEETTWPGSFIPIVPVYGAELFIDGKRILEGVIRHAKDPQRMYNYWKSAETETIALAPRAPFIVADGQLEGFEQFWKTANRKNHSYLPYKPISAGGQPLPPPQRSNTEPATQAITQASLAAGEDLKATTGIYDAGQGAVSNETSGIAINNRTRQIQTSTFHFTDNFKRSLKHTGRILVDLIPKIYDTARAIRIIGSDDAQKVVQINQKHTDESGKEVLYDLSVGRYDVAVDTGPSFQTKRQEASNSMMDFSRSVPQVAQACADLIAKNMDWPGAQEIADRLKKMLPPQLQDEGPLKDVPPQITAQLQSQGEMIKNLTDHLNEAVKVIETKKLDLEHKERVELMRIQAQLEMKAAELGSKEDMALLNHQISEIQGRLELLQMQAPIQASNDFDPSQADGGNYAGIGHIGGTTNIPGGETPGLPTGGHSPGQPMEGI